MPKKEIIDTYKKATNMTYSELLKWSRNPLSQTASLKPFEESLEAQRERRKLKNYLPKEIREESRNFNTAQIRNLVLLKTPFKDWNLFLEIQSKKAISYLARAKKGKGTKNRRALMNWAFRR